MIVGAKTGGNLVLDDRLLKQLSQGRSNSVILNLATHLAPALPLIAPCQLDSMLEDDVERRATSELARLARLLWHDEKAAKLYGHVSQTYIELLHTRGDTIEERAANYIDDMLAL